MGLGEGRDLAVKPEAKENRQAEESGMEQDYASLRAIDAMRNPTSQAIVVGVKETLDDFDSGDVSDEGKGAEHKVNPWRGAL